MSADSRTHVKRSGHRGWPCWAGGSLTGFYVGLRIRGGALHFGVKLFRDRSRHYGNAKHAEYGIAFWCRRARRGDRGYPHTLTLKVVVA